MSGKNNALHHTPYKNIIVERIKSTDEVKVSVEKMPSIPAGANPFHHDASLMGTNISRGWILMHSGEFGEHGHDFMYLVNTITGQRIGLGFEAVEENYCESVWCGREDLDESELYVWERFYDTVAFTTLAEHMRSKAQCKPIIRGYKTSPVYVYCNGNFIRVDVFYDQALRDKWCEENDISIDESHPAVMVAKRWEAAQRFVAGAK